MLSAQIDFFHGNLNTWKQISIPWKTQELKKVYKGYPERTTATTIPISNLFNGFKEQNS